MSKNIDAPLLIEEFKVRLESNPNLTLTEFSREKGIGNRRLQRWCNEHQIRISELKAQVLIRHGYRESILTKADERYSLLLEEYKKELLKRRNLTMEVFCRERGEYSSRMSKWLNRQGFTVTDIKKSVLEQDAFPSVADSVIMGLGDSAIARFRKTLKEYKELLSVRANQSLKDFCGKHNVDYVLFTKWLKIIGVSDRSLRQEAKLNRKKPGGELGSVFVQFKPNGGSIGDQLKGVKIFFPDGSRIEVEGCTVISLCNFIQVYDNQQRRKNLIKDV